MQVLRTFFIPLPFKKFPFKKIQDTDKVTKSFGDGIFVEILSDIDSGDKIDNINLVIHDTTVKKNISGVHVVIKISYATKLGVIPFRVTSNFSGIDRNLSPFLTRSSSDVAKIIRAVERKFIKTDNHLTPVFSSNPRSKINFSELKRVLGKKLESK